jgi:hypothetical protein
MPFNIYNPCSITGLRLKRTRDPASTRTITPQDSLKTLILISQ